MTAGTRTKETFSMGNLMAVVDPFAGLTVHSMKGHGKMAFSMASVCFEPQM